MGCVLCLPRGCCSCGCTHGRPVPPLSQHTHTHAPSPPPPPPCSCKPLLIATYNPEEGALREHLLDRIAITLSADVPWTAQQRVIAADAATRFQDSAAEVIRETEDTTDGLRSQARARACRLLLLPLSVAGAACCRLLLPRASHTEPPPTRPSARPPTHPLMCVDPVCARVPA